MNAERPALGAVSGGIGVEAHVSRHVTTDERLAGELECPKHVEGEPKGSGQPEPRSPLSVVQVSPAASCLNAREGRAATSDPEQAEGRGVVAWLALALVSAAATWILVLTYRLAQTLLVVRGL